MAILIAVLPCINGDRLEIYRESGWSACPVAYFLNSKEFGNCQSISEYEARTIMHEEGFLFCELKLSDHVPTVASGELPIP
jgi:hypothetical protein